MKRLAVIVAAWLGLAGSLCAQTFPGDWAGYATHSITTEPASNLTDFTYFVSLDQLPSSFWTAVQTDGDDIRASSDAAGTTQLPVDIILFTDSGSSGSGLIAVKYSGTKSSSVDQPIYIWSGCASASRPADTDTYGRENAYASHVRAFWPSGAGTDRTQYDNDLTMSGSPTDGGTAGPINGSTATDYNGTSQYGTATASVPTTTPIVILAVANSDNNTSAKSIASVADTAVVNHYFVMQDRGADSGDPVYATTAAGGFAFAQSASGFTTATWQSRVAAFNSTTSRYAGLNGVLGTQNTTSISPTSIDTIAVGAWVTTSPSQHYDGKLSFVRLHTDALSADWIAYDAAMFADPDQSDFYGTWSWTASSGGNDGAFPQVIISQLDPRRAWQRFISHTPLALVQ